MIHVGDCIEVMRGLEAGSVDAIVTDPPYGIRFMGKAWDGIDIEKRAQARRDCPSKHDASGPNGAHNSMAAEAGKYDLSPKGMRAFQEFSAEWAREAIRVAKPGAHCVAFASPRTFHRLVCGLEEAGWEIRDTLMWVFGSGFPKSHNGDWGGTALKPAWEPIVLARKPLAGTVEANWREHGTGALNIDGCRIEAEARAPITGRGGIPARTQDEAPRDAGVVAQPHALGRWPANLLHDGSSEVLAAFPNAPGQQRDTGPEFERSAQVYGTFAGVSAHAARGDSGSAARFFYCAKADRADRNDGCDGLPKRTSGMVSNTSGQHMTRRDGGAPPPAENHHPTVKPTDLMRWLCRLVTPPGGLVLDPFTGSGSTGRGAIAEGFRFTGIELDPAYAAIAEARIRAVQPGLSFGAAA